jgi:hypothetical protein
MNTYNKLEAIRYVIKNEPDEMNPQLILEYYNLIIEIANNNVEEFDEVLLDMELNAINDSNDKYIKEVRDKLYDALSMWVPRKYLGIENNEE